MSLPSRVRCGAALGLIALAGHAAAQAPYIGTGSGSDGPGGLYGHSVAQLHDVNGDGFHELLVGAPGHDENGTDSGAVIVVDGVHGFIEYELHGSLAGDELGWSVANLGDVNGDGIDDFAAGRPGRDFLGAIDAGGVEVHSGSDGSLLWSKTWTAAGARAGSVVAAAGDVNGDGRGDVLVGAPAFDGPSAPADPSWGRAVLYSGATGAVLKTVTGTVDNDRLGAALAGLPDLNGDGVPEFAIGVPGREVGSPFALVNAGACDVYSGLTKALLFSVDGGAANEACGSSVARLGDTDHDGSNEFVVGRPGWSSDRGRVTVHEGKTGKLIRTLEGPALSAADTYGTAVCAAGDVNKDGHVDLLVGAPCAGTGFGGYTQVVSGKDWTQYGDILNSSDVFGSALEWGFGTTIAAGIDTSGDGWVDAVYGMPTSTIGGLDNGFVWGIRFTWFQPDYDPSELYQGPGSADLQIYGTKLSTGGLADLQVSGAPDFTPVYVLASLAGTPSNFKGGVLVPQVSGALIIPLVTDVHGRATLTGIPGGHGPLHIHMQALLPVPGAPQGWWLSNAITAELLP